MHAYQLIKKTIEIAQRVDLCFLEVFGSNRDKEPEQNSSPLQLVLPMGKRVAVAFIGSSGMSIKNNQYDLGACQQYTMNPRHSFAP